MKKIKIAGVGEMIFDHQFVEEKSSTYYSSSRGGGSVWNVLANLSQMEFSCIAMGVFGENTPYGKIAKNELTELGIDTRFVMGVDKKYSRIVFETLNKNEFNNSHSFTDKCVICSKRPNDTKIARLKSSSDLVTTLFKENIDVIVVDRLTKDRVEIVRDLRKIKPNIISIIDVGRISYLRFVPTPQIVSYLSEFNIIFANNIDALTPLLKRLGVRDRGEYLQSFIKKGNTKYIVATKGQQGYDIIFENKILTEKAPMFDEVTDSAGAGDAFLASFIANILRVDIDSIYDDEKVVASLRKSAIDIEVVLKSFGARGHLKLNRTINLPTEKYIGLHTNKIKENIGSINCPFCFLTNDEPKLEDISNHKYQKGSISKTIADLSNRLLFTFERKSAIEQCKEILKISGTIHVVGTGGSFISAFYISQVLNDKGASFSIPVRPFDYLNSVNKKSNALVILTYSGSTPDYEPVIKKATDMGVEKIYFITHSKKPKLSTLLPHETNLFESSFLTKGVLINYSADKSQRERGFISIAGTLLPSFLFLLAGLGDKIDDIDYNSLLEEKRNREYEELPLVASSIKEHRIIEVYGGGMSWSAMLDLESKLIEGGVCAVQLHEFKDFSHGRFMFSLKNKFPKIVLQVDENPYIDKLIQTLEDYEESVPLLVIKSNEKGIIGSLELLIEVQYLIHKLTNLIYGEVKVDITKPKNIPSKGLELYRWKFN